MFCQKADYQKIFRIFPGKSKKRGAYYKTLHRFSDLLVKFRGFGGMRVQFFAPL